MENRLPMKMKKKTKNNNNDDNSAARSLHRWAKNVAP
jgi:hypothetical protein